MLTSSEREETTTTASGGGRMGAHRTGRRGGGRRNDRASVLFDDENRNDDDRAGDRRGAMADHDGISNAFLYDSDLSAEKGRAIYCAGGKRRGGHGGGADRETTNDSTEVVRGRVGRGDGVPDRRNGGLLRDGVGGLV